MGKIAAFLMVLCLLFTGCAAGASAPAALPEEAEPYSIPPMAGACFHEETAEDWAGIRVDFSEMADGYIALRTTVDAVLKFQIELGEEKYNYNVPCDDSDVILPLNMGSGSYSFRLLQNAGGNKYACLISDTREVSLNDEFGPFVRPSQMVPYGENSDCVALARELAGTCCRDSDVVSAIYDYLVTHIAYDQQKAETVEPGYLPSPDHTLAEGKGICFDYASLAAAMMRSVGIPCKLITGYVDGDLYHAWNCFYLQEQGWVTVEIKAKPGLWQRVDITMAASGKRTSELEDDTKYTTRYTY